MKIIFKKSELLEKGSSSLTKIVMALVRTDNAYQDKKYLSEFLGIAYSTIRKKVKAAVFIPTTVEEKESVVIDIPNHILQDGSINSFAKIVYGLKNTYKAATAEWVLQSFQIKDLRNTALVYNIFQGNNTNFQIQPFQSLKSTKEYNYTTQNCEGQEGANPAKSCHVSDESEKGKIEEIETKSLKQLLADKYSEVSKLKAQIDELQKNKEELEKVFKEQISSFKVELQVAKDLAYENYCKYEEVMEQLQNKNQKANIINGVWGTLKKEKEGEKEICEYATQSEQKTKAIN